ncbi:MAG: SIMPL domain-containing protein [Hyphomonas sp.]
MRPFLPTFASVAVIALLLPQAACAQLQALTEEAPPPMSAPAMTAQSVNPNSIQPETTLEISAQASVKREPDIAYLSTGVQVERKTAAEAMAAQAEAMSGVFKALEKAGIAKKDMQTSNLSLYPRYDYIEVRDKDGSMRGEQRLAGYTASNQLTVKVRDLDNLGKTMDSLINAGGNTFSGVSFALEDASEAQDEARRKAMTDAVARANLYAGAAGLRVLRIVKITEGGGYSPQPVPMMRQAEMAMADASFSTPVAGGEVGYDAYVNVMFELGR